MAELPTNIPTTQFEYAELAHGIEKEDPKMMHEGETLAYSATELVSDNMRATLEGIMDISPLEMANQSRLGLQQFYEVFDAKTVLPNYIDKEIKLARGESIDVSPGEQAAFNRKEYDLEIKPINAAKVGGLVSAAEGMYEGTDDINRLRAENPEKVARFKELRAQVDSKYEQEILENLAKEEVRRIAELAEPLPEPSNFYTDAPYYARQTVTVRNTPMARQQEKARKKQAYQASYIR